MIAKKLAVATYPSRSTEYHLEFGLRGCTNQSITLVVRTARQRQRQDSLRLVTDLNLGITVYLLNPNFSAACFRSTSVGSNAVSSKT